MRAAAILIMAFAAMAMGQEAATAHPAVELPPGYVRVEAAQRMVITPAGQAASARAVLEAVAAPELPSTMPADLAARLRDRRARIIDRIEHDLLLEDRQAVETFYDQTLLPAITKYDAAPLEIAYFWSPRDQLKEAIKGGWSNPRFHYNRAADEVMIHSRLDLNIDAPPDETLLPALHDAGATDEQRREILIKAIQDAERGIAGELASRAQLQVHLEFAQFIDSQLQDRLQETGQAWLRLGLSGALAAEYASIASGIDAIAFVRVVVVEPPRTPVRAAGVDLLNPTPLQDLREQYVQPYLEAMRRKSTAVVFDWMTQVGAEAVPATLRVIKERAPADGAGLVSIIRETTGIDLTDKLRPF